MPQEPKEKLHKPQEWEPDPPLTLRAHIFQLPDLRF